MTKTILLVEDEALIAMTEAKMLEKHGFEVVTAYNGKKAVEAVDSDPEISLILMDIDLGKGMEGTETAGEILSHHDIPIVFLTSHSEKEMVDKVKGITRYGYVLKNAGEFVLLESITMAYELFNANNSLEKENEERLRVEKTRDEYYKHLSSTFSAVDSLLALVDKNYRIILSNWKEHEWIPEKEREERPYCYKAFKGFDSPCKDCPTMQTFKDGTYRQYEDRNPIDGSYKKISIIPIFGDDGEVNYVLENVQDITEYKQLQEKYKGLFDNAPLPYQSLDNNGFFLEINPAWLEALGGYTREEVLGKSFADFLHPDSVSVFRDNLKKQKKDGTAENNTYKMKKKNGGYMDASFKGRITYTPEGNVKQTHCIFKDVSEERRMQTELRKSEEKYKLLFDHSNDAIFVHGIGKDNLPGNNIEVNEQACKLLKYSKKELLSMSARDVLPEKQAATMLPNARELIKRKHLVFETENIRSDGVVIPVEVSAYWYQENGKQFAVASVRDITERRRAEMKLRRSEKIFRQMFTKHHAIMLLIDPDTGEIANANTSASRYYGFSVDELCQMTIQQINTMPAKEVAHERILAAKEKRNHFFFSHRLRNGEIRDVEVHSTLIEVGEKKVLFSIIHDITERRRAEDSLREAVKEKDFLMKELNHRVKNNLLMVTSLISLKNSESENDLSGIQHQIETIGLIHGKLYKTDNVTAIGSRNYISDLLSSIFSSFTARRVRIEANIDEISIPAKSAMPLGLIVNEIATNAIKHGFNEKEEAVFSVNMKENKENSRYELTLSNTGNPFPEDIDVDNSQTLGLRLITALTEQLGGTIDLKREPRPVFTIRFPIGGADYGTSTDIR